GNSGHLQSHRRWPYQRWFPHRLPSWEGTAQHVQHQLCPRTDHRQPDDSQTRHRRQGQGVQPLRQHRLYLGPRWLLLLITTIAQAAFRVIDRGDRGIGTLRAHDLATYSIGCDSSPRNRSGSAMTSIAMIRARATANVITVTTRWCGATTIATLPATSA